MKRIQLLIMLLMVVKTFNAQNESKLIIDASDNQTNDHPLILLQTSTGGPLMWIHSDHYSNAFVGNGAGLKNMPYSGGTGNTFNGYSTGRENKTGGGNTAMGSGALYNNVSGGANTVSGFNALSQNSSGNSNTAFGYFALATTVGSENNTAIGANAGTTHNNGWNNVFVGANTDVNTSGLYNVIAIGQTTTVTASNTARFGNSFTGSYGGWANWTNVSDGRYKKNVKANVVGLDFIMKLQPVTYNLDVNGLRRELNEDRGRAPEAQLKAAIIEKERMVQTGFIAQDVEKAAQEVGYDFSGVDAPKNESDFYGLRYAEFVVPLVKAVQELSEQIGGLKSLTDDLVAEVERLKAEVEIKELKIGDQLVELHLLKERMDELEEIAKVDRRLY